MAQTTTTTSKFLSLNMKDFWRGLLIAVGTPVFALLITALNEGGFKNINWEALGIAGLSAGLMYISKNLFTASEIVVQNASAATIDAVNKGTKEVELVAATPPPDNPR